MTKGIITLCGSTRFKQEFDFMNSALTKAEYIVLSVGTFVRDEYHDPNKPETIALKKRLDAIHLEKIAISRCIVVLNKDGYIGESTRHEMDYARSINLPIYFLEGDFAHRSYKELLQF